MVKLFSYKLQVAFISYLEELVKISLKQLMTCHKLFQAIS